MIKRPLKAPTEILQDNDLININYPVVGSPKLDGFRCVIDGYPKTSSMKPQPNPYVFEELNKPEYQGLDGELIVGNPNDPDIFNKSTGPLRRHYGKPDFTFYTFDDFTKIDENYTSRWLFGLKSRKILNKVVYLKQLLLRSPEDIKDFTQICIAKGYEGAIIRSLTGRYKQGRATYKEMNIFKRKVLSDAEATIIGFNEQMTNLNAQKTNELGLAYRQSNKDLKFGAGILGSFILKSDLWEKPFKCRGKIDNYLAKEIWENQSKYIGKVVTFKYHAYGSLNAPRQPIFHRFFKEL